MHVMTPRGQTNDSVCSLKRTKREIKITESPSNDFACDKEINPVTSLSFTVRLRSGYGGFIFVFTVSSFSLATLHVKDKKREEEEEEEHKAQCFMVGFTAD